MQRLQGRTGSSRRAEPVHGTAFTGAPGTIIFWKPSTMTWSPSFRPSRITHWLFWALPTLTGRGPGLPSSPTTSTVSPWLVRVTACWGSRMPEGSSACDRRTRTYWPGKSRPSALGTSARRVIWPLVASTVRSLNSSLPGFGQLAAVFQHDAHRHRAIARGAQLLGGNGFAQAQHLGAGLGEVHIHRAGLLDGGQRGGVSSTHQGTFGHRDWPIRPEIGAVMVA